MREVGADLWEVCQVDADGENRSCGNADESCAGAEFEDVGLWGKGSVSARRGNGVRVSGSGERWEEGNKMREAFRKEIRCRPSFVPKVIGREGRFLKGNRNRGG